MSTIPPNWLGSIIQSHDAQRRADADRSVEQAAAAERARDPSAADSRNIIENDDTDSSVYSDAEGAGSQGRSFSEEESEEEQREESTEKGLSEGGLDIEA